MLAMQDNEEDNARYIQRQAVGVLVGPPAIVRLGGAL